jgi:5S rRNA maturation endonuclease (ribonuclease M5)
MNAESTVFYCHGCGVTGASIRSLLYVWCKEYGKDYQTLKEELLGSDQRNIIKRMDKRKSRPAYAEDKINQSDFVAESSVTNNRNDDNDKALIHAIEKYNVCVGKMHEYVLNRGISSDVCREAKLGFHGDEQRIYFPLRSLPWGNIVGIMTRGIGKTPDYYFNNGFKKNALYLEYETWENPFKTDIVLVEGSFDSLKLRTYGYNSVALLGSLITAPQVVKIGLLCYKIANTHKMESAGSKPNIVIMMDADQAGETAVRQIIDEMRELRRKYTIRVARLPKEKDPADATKEEVEASLRTSEVVRDGLPI